ncbi:MAG: M24 family metallopeptidase [Hyphomicrobiales bacterium]
MKRGELTPRYEPEPFRVPRSEIERRTAALQEELRRAGIDGLFIVQRTDLFYFSGTAQNGFLYLPAEGKPLLFIKQSISRARAESALEPIIEINSIKAVPGLITDFYGRSPSRLALELDVLPVNEFRFYRNLFNPKDCVDGSPFILYVRRIKSAWEIAQLESTADMTRSTFGYMRTVIAPGLTEMEFAGMFEAYARTIGHGGKLRVRHYNTEGYPWHVLSGSSGGLVGVLDSPASGEGTSAAFPAGAGHRRLCKDEPIMVDLGSVMNGYHLDETRMFAIGSMPEKAYRASRTAIEIHDAVIERARPGAILGELFDLAWDMAARLGFEDFFLGPPGNRVNFIGHGIGLELVEPPIIARGRDVQLEDGMVFALEPKLVYANEFAAGVESVFQVTPAGGRLISKVPVEIFICR